MNINDKAFDWAIDYKPWEENLPYRDYARHGFTEGARWAQDQDRKVYTVAVYNDEQKAPAVYRVPASSELDARVLAFVLDGGTGANERGELEEGHVQLALTWTEIR